MEMNVNPPADDDQSTMEQLKQRLKETEAALLEMAARSAAANATVGVFNMPDHLLDEVFNTILASMAYLDRELRIVRVNRAFARVAGQPQQFFPGKKYFDLFPSAESAAVFQKVLETGKPLMMNAMPYLPSEETGQAATYWDWSLQPLTSPEGSIQGLLLTAVNVTEEVNSQARLEENQRMFQSLFNSAPDATLVVDSQGKILRVNQLVALRFGYDPQELLGERIEKLIPERFQSEHSDLRDEYHREPVTRPMGIGLSLFARRKDGSEFPVDVNLSPVEVGGETQVICVVRDISARVQAEKSFHQQAAYVKLLQDIASAANSSDSVEEVLQLALDRICAAIGWQVGHAVLVQDGIGLRSTGLWHIDEPEKLTAFRAVSEDQDFNFGGLPTLIYRTGRAAWVEDVATMDEFRRKPQARAAGLTTWFSFPILVGSEVVGVLEFFANRFAELNPNALETLANIGEQLGRVVERRRALEAVRRSEARFRAIFDRTAIGIQLLDAEGNILDTNPALQQILGYSAGELRLLSLTTITHPDDLEDSLSILDALLRGKQTAYQAETRFRHQNGQLVWTELTGSLVFDGTGKLLFVLLLVRDISELKRKTAELEEVQRKLLESAEMERISLARDLHDGPLQDLYGASYALQDFLTEIEPSDITAPVENANITMQRVINRLRIICGELRPPSLNPFGLEKAIRSHAERLRDLYPHPLIHLELIGDRQMLSEQARLALFRVYQQLVGNVLRHAKAENLWVRFRLEANMVVLEVEDDGLGFVPPERWVDLAREGHAGLLGVLERVEVFGGTMEVERNRARGSHVRVRIPRERISAPDAR